MTMTWFCSCESDRSFLARPGDIAPGAVIERDKGLRSSDIFLAGLRFEVFCVVGNKENVEDLVEDVEGVRRSRLGRSRS